MRLQPLVSPYTPLTSSTRNTTVPDPEAGSEPPKVELEVAAGGWAATGVLVFGLGAIMTSEMSVDLSKV